MEGLVAGKGGWHRFGLSGAPLPGSQLQGRNRNFSQLGVIPPWGNMRQNRETCGHYSWWEMLNSWQEKPQHRTSQPQVSVVPSGEMLVSRSQENPLTSRGPCGEALSLSRWFVFWEVSAGLGEPTAPSCLQHHPARGAGAAQCPRPAKPTPLVPRSGGQ